MSSESVPQTVRIGSAELTVRDVLLPRELMIDEISIEAPDICLTGPGTRGEQPVASAGVSRFRATITEPNVNRVLLANMPTGTPVKDLKVSVLSGKIRLSIHTSGFLSIPFSLDTVPRIINGLKIVLDWHSASALGIPLPSQLVDALEQKINKTLDLSHSPVPLWIDNLQCEPGRLILTGSARFAFPLQARPAFSGPFSAAPFPSEALDTVREESTGVSAEYDALPPAEPPL